MNLRNKIIIIITFCIILSVGSIVIINRIFDKTEDQLLRKCQIEALVGAKVMSTFMEMLIHTNTLTYEQIMDTNYREIPGSNPKKYNTQYDAVFDQTIQKFEDEFLNDEDVVFAILFDRNGYVPTHNSKYSRPEGKNRELNLNYSRSKRMYANTPEIREILKYRGSGTVRYLYTRDTGEPIWNIGAPVWLRGECWGAFLIGISLHRIDIIKNQMVIITVTIMIIILSFTLLILLSVIPQKYLVADPPRSEVTVNTENPPPDDAP
ncbi:MAG: hypothetical protein JXA07_11285 [Spirochaetes bacterium]|nr:hypothetical protein [Spirochaetota bacterium]